ncbi:APC family permease [Craterilacuibacter sp. RT1T]|uniref:APC family permease n=1 Tax=Craterilacuibacter sp. RT1T TaxID=2942211 RepID=UPI0020BDE4D4|nr:APC family permease [Craterilacuibacter sp. RT1T]MCL6263204.1 APC family permease [Craterilacuibacter sp. RT1T]
MSVPATSAAKFGPLSIFLLGLNTTIGSGIFLLPGAAYAALGPSSLLLIIAGALLMLSLALCYAEAASKFDRNGSSYLYVRYAFGDYAGFIVGLYGWLGLTIGIAAGVAGILTALKPLLPVLVRSQPYYWAGLLVLCALFAISFFGIRLSRRFNDLTSWAKLLPLLLFVLFGLSSIIPGHFQPFVPPAEHTLPLWSEHFGHVFATLFFAYVGFETVPIAAAHMREPERNLPRTLIAVVACCALLYLLVTLVTIGVLGPALSHSSTPVAQAAARLWGAQAYVLVSLATVVSITGATFVGVFKAPILAAALAQNGIFPAWAGRINRHGSAGYALGATASLAALLFLSGGYLFLVSVMVVAVFVQYIPVALAIPRLRRDPGLPQGWRMPLGRFVPHFAVLFSLAMLAQAGWRTLAIGLAGLVLGSLVYFVRQRS